VILDEFCVFFLVFLHFFVILNDFWCFSCLFEVFVSGLR
jgi:hypothetical protein